MSYGCASQLHENQPPTASTHRETPLVTASAQSGSTRAQPKDRSITSISCSSLLLPRQEPPASPASAATCFDGRRGNGKESIGCNLFSRSGQHHKHQLKPVRSSPATGLWTVVFKHRRVSKPCQPELCAVCFGTTHLYSRSLFDTKIFDGTSS